MTCASLTLEQFRSYPDYHRKFWTSCLFKSVIKPHYRKAKCNLQCQKNSFFIPKIWTWLVCLWYLPMLHYRISLVRSHCRSSDPPPGSMLWYDSSPEAHPRLHKAHLSPLLENGPTPRTLKPLIHSLRAVKSSAEVALMQAAGHISSQVGHLNPIEPHYVEIKCFLLIVWRLTLYFCLCFRPLEEQWLYVMETWMNLCSLQR